MYVCGYWKEFIEPWYTEHMSVYFNNGEYNDAIALYGVNRQKLRGNSNMLIDTLVNLADVFKIRETSSKTIEPARKLIASLKSTINTTLEEQGKVIDEKLKLFYSKNREFANEVLEGKGKLNDKNFDSLRDVIDKAERKQDNILINS